MPQLRRYHAWSIAAVRFSSTPDNLSEAQRAQLDLDVDRAVAIEAVILASPEATSVAIPVDQQSFAAAEWRETHPSCELSDADIMVGVRRELLVQAILDGVASRAPRPTEADAKAYYLSDPKSFALPERRVVRHILITIDADNDEKAARLQAEQLLALCQSSDEFIELAGRHSDCPTGMQGGLIGTVSKGTLYPAVEDLVFAMEEGCWDGPVKTHLGWHLVYCEAILPAQSQDFASVSSKIRELLSSRMRRTAQVEWLKGLSEQSAA